MSERRFNSAAWLKIPLDLVLTCLTLFTAYGLASIGFPLELSHGIPDFKWYVGVLPVYLGIFLFVAVFFRLYQPRRVGSFGRLFYDLLKVNGQTTLVLLAISFYVREFSFSRLIFTYFFVLNPLILFLHHTMWMARERRRYRAGIATKTCLVVGRGELAAAVAQRLEENPWTGLSVHGFVDTGRPMEPDSRVTETVSDDLLLGEVEDLRDIVAEHKIEEVIVAVPFRDMGILASIDRHLAQSAIGLRWVPDLETLNTLQRQVTDFDGMPVINLRGVPVYGLGAFLKRSLDVALSVAMLITLSPLLVVTAMVIRVTSGSPVLFRQERVGLDGRVFQLLKFRTMVQDAERDSGPVFADANDSRATPFGLFLRRTAIDELPQLFNVLAGQMSLVGPRPERPVFIEEFKKTVPRYMLRHRVKAGLTGWAQINGWRGKTSLYKRIQYDLYYMRNWTLWFDLKILFLTPFRAWSKRWNAS